MSDDVVVRAITDVVDLRACQEVQRRAWDIAQDGYTLPVATMVAVGKYGGLILGAWQAGRLVGFSFAFLGRLRDQQILYSQLTAVLPDVQGGGVGYRLKIAQREWARAQRLPLIVWAFDPMQSGNAHFNIARLGATCRSYERDMYGERNDALNTGLATDRLIAEWPTDGSLPSEPNGVEALPVSATLDCEIPANVRELAAQNLAEAQRQQSVIRTTLTDAFSKGYGVTGFVRKNDPIVGRRCWYLLTKNT